MPGNEQTIEAEVVEIDGIEVRPRATPGHRSGKDWKNWRNLQAHVLKLDSRWWPLWVALGIIALVLVVAIGMCAAVLWIAYRLLVGLFLGFASLFDASTELQRR